MCRDPRYDPPTIRRRKKCATMGLFFGSLNLQGIKGKNTEIRFPCPWFRRSAGFDGPKVCSQKKERDTDSAEPLLNPNA
jgi:hypothetical protein